MLKLYDVGGVTFQFEEGKEPTGARLLASKPIKDAESKSQASPKNKSAKAKNK